MNAVEQAVANLKAKQDLLEAIKNKLTNSPLTLDQKKALLVAAVYANWGQMPESDEVLNGCNREQLTLSTEGKPEIILTEKNNMWRKGKPWKREIYSGPLTEKTMDKACEAININKIDKTIFDRYVTSLLADALTSIQTLYDNGDFSENDWESIRQDRSEIIEALFEIEDKRLIENINTSNSAIDKKGIIKTYLDNRKSDLRKFNQPVEIHFRGLDLTGIDFRRIDLSNVMFTQCKLSFCKFSANITANQLYNNSALVKIKPTNSNVIAETLTLRYQEIRAQFYNVKNGIQMNIDAIQNKKPAVIDDIGQLYESLSPCDFSEQARAALKISAEDILVQLDWLKEKAYFTLQTIDEFKSVLLDNIELFELHVVHNRKEPSNHLAEALNNLKALLCELSTKRNDVIIAEANKTFKLKQGLIEIYLKKIQKADTIEQIHKLTDIIQSELLKSPYIVFRFPNQLTCRDKKLNKSLYKINKILLDHKKNLILYLVKYIRENNNYMISLMLKAQVIDDPFIIIHRKNGNKTLIEFAFIHGNLLLAKHLLTLIGKTIPKNLADQLQTIAIKNRHDSLLELLENYNVTINAESLIKLGRFLDFKKRFFTLLKENNNKLDFVNDQYLVHLAIEYEDLSILKWLLETHTLDLTKPNPQGLTPLQLACRKGNPEIINVLLREIDRNSREVENTDYLLSLKPSPLKLIIDQFIEERQNHAKQKNKYNPRDLHAICEQLGEILGCDVKSAIILEKFNHDHSHMDVILSPVMRLVHQNKQYTDDHGNLLSIVIDNYIYSDYPEILNALIKELIKQGVQINHINKNHETPLGLACKHGLKHIAKILIFENALLAPFGSKPALISAIEGGNSAIVELLLNRQANPDAEWENRKAIAYANDLADKTIYNMLKEKAEAKKNNYRTHYLLADSRTKLPVDNYHSHRRLALS